jgi:DNA-binding transcriptional LysR family regulator
MSTLLQITAFIAVVEEQSFAGAARKQGVSTAAISRQISQLEAELKSQLLQRSTRRVELTEVGFQYYQHVKKTLDELEEAERAISSSQSEAVGLLHVSTDRYFAKEFLFTRLPEFMQLNPKLKIKFEFAERFSDISKESIDVIFGSTQEQAPDVVQRRVGTTRFVLCASKDYLKKYGTPQVPLDLHHHRYITHSGRNPDNQVPFSNHPPVFVEPVLWLNESHAIAECAINGMGIARLHHCIVDKALQSGELVEILSEFREPEKPVFLYYQHSRYLQPKIRRFVDFYTA